MNERQPINDELMMPCAQCARKHLSAAISYYANTRSQDAAYWRVLFARAIINLCEADEGYVSHRRYAIGLVVQAEEDCNIDADCRRMLREFRLAVQDGKRGTTLAYGVLQDIDFYLAHVLEAEREYPDIRTVVDREPFYRDNMSDVEVRQAEVNYRLAQLRWLDENVFGLKAVEKGDDDMAIAKKAAVKPAAKAAVKAACKGGKAKKACKGCKK